MMLQKSTNQSMKQTINDDAIMPDVTKAVQLLRAGELVAFPTETVYGLGADANNASAIHKIFTLKERPSTHPLIVHIGQMSELGEWAEYIPKAALKLAKAFWPGPLTLILLKRTKVLDTMTGGQATIGIRIPRHPIAQILLKAFGGGIAAPSANKFTRISPTDANAVQAEFGKALKLILDGGRCEIGLESTIVDMSSERPRILRPGMIAVDKIEQVLGQQVDKELKTTTRAAGMHPLHYAPVTKTKLIHLADLDDKLAQLTAKELPVAVLTHNHSKINLGLDNVIKISMPAYARPYAQVLYQTLRHLDGENYKQILIEEVPKEKAWDAIRDRLIKATGMRK